jgi:two-component system NtrC family response regulator
MSESAIIEPQDLGFAEPAAEGSEFKFEGLTLKEAKDRLERNLVISAIEKQEGNMVKAAEALGVSRPTIYDLMKKHKLSQ